MPENETLVNLMTDISQRMAALGAAVTPEAIRAMVQEQFSALVNDEQFVRKMRFGGGTDKKIVGTRYARWNLKVHDVEFFYDLMNSMRGRALSNGSTHPGPSEELSNTFNAISDSMYLSEDEVRAMDVRAIDNLFPRIPLSWFRGEDRRIVRKDSDGKTVNFELTAAYKRAMDSAETGYGAQLIGAGYVGDLWEAARRDTVVFGTLDSFEMTDPTMYLPVEVDFPEMLFVGESTLNNSSNYGTSKTGSQRVQVDAKKFVIHQMWSGELEEDSIIAFIPFIRRQSQLGMNFYLDSLVINGDTTNAATGNINSDDEDPADTKHFLAFDGIRHVGLVDNTSNSKALSAALTYPDLVAPRGRMMDQTNKVDWGHPVDPADLIHVADPETCDAISLLDEVITVDKFGAQATVINGQQARIGRHSLLASMAVSKTEADGKVSYDTPANNVKGQLVTYNRRGFKVGWRRRVKTETERIIGTDQTRIVHSLRLGFGRFSASGAVSGIEAADVIYNIPLS